MKHLLSLGSEGKVMHRDGGMASLTFQGPSRSLKPVDPVACMGDAFGMGEGRNGGRGWVMRSDVQEQ